MSDRTNTTTATAPLHRETETYTTLERRERDLEGSVDSGLTPAEAFELKLTQLLLALYDADDRLDGAHIADPTFRTVDGLDRAREAGRAWSRCYDAGLALPSLNPTTAQGLAALEGALGRYGTPAPGTGAPLGRDEFAGDGADLHVDAYTLAPAPAAMGTCPDCGGDGYTETEDDDPESVHGVRVGRVPCWTCDETGEVEEETAPVGEHAGAHN